MTGSADPLVIMVTHNSAAQVAESLGSLRGQQVRVVDNASTDPTVEIVRRQFPQVAVTARGDNPGFAVAVNDGLDSLDGQPVVILVNPDCVVGPGTVAALTRYLLDHPGVGVVGPRIVDALGWPTVSAHPFETLLSVIASRFGAGLLPASIRRRLGGAARRRAYVASEGGSSAPVEVDWLSGACLAVRAELLVRLGGLDEAYFLYYEDEELCWQVHEQGAAVVLLPGVVARHVGGASSGLGATWPHLYRSMIIFFARHRPATLPALRAVVCARALVGMSLAGIRVLLARPTARARARAWGRIARIALTYRPSRHPGPQPSRQLGPRSTPRPQEVTTCGS